MGFLSPARMVLDLLRLLISLVLNQSQALDKPGWWFNLPIGQVRPTAKHRILEADQDLKILWTTYKFLTKENQAMFLSAILPPYLGALFRSMKTEKNTIRNIIMPYPRNSYFETAK